MNATRFKVRYEIWTGHILQVWSLKLGEAMATRSNQKKFSRRRRQILLFVQVVLLV